MRPIWIKNQNFRVGFYIRDYTVETSDLVYLCENINQMKVNQLSEPEESIDVKGIEHVIRRKIMKKMRI